MCSFVFSVLLNEERGKKKIPHSQPQNCFPMSSKEFRQRERESKQCPTIFDNQEIGG